MIKYFNSYEEIQKTITKALPFIIVGGKTSTVIPFHSSELELDIWDISKIPGQIKYNKEEKTVNITGSVSWKEAKAELQSFGRMFKSTPTEELAFCLSGIATSATGERSFGFGPLRNHVKEVEYIDHKGKIKILKKENPLSLHPLFQSHNELLTKYNKDCEKYKNFKNAPFPILNNEVDLMIGTEGQLGIIKSAVFETTESVSLKVIFIPVSRWEESTNPHIEILNKIQRFKELVYSCEMIDSNSLKKINETTIDSNFDYIILEVREDHIEKVFEDFLSNLSFISLEHIFEMNAKDYHEFRMNVPREVAEYLSRNQLKKLGTDTQVKIHCFKELLEYYKKFTDYNSEYLLFGHFGDAHLHFNFLPKKEDFTKCKDHLIPFYQFVKKINGSPFAEHGIGLLKKDYIRPFYSGHQNEMFSYLKKEMDPKNIFFPLGFMSF